MARRRRLFGAVSGVGRVIAGIGVALCAMGGASASAQQCEIISSVDGRVSASFDSVRSFTQFDADGPNSPEPNLMVFGGAFQNAEGLTNLGGVVGWDGTRFVAIGRQTDFYYPDGPIDLLFQYDDDGPAGPHQNLLYAIRNNNNGTFTVFSWARLGSGWFRFDVPGQVHAVTTWDPDGPGGSNPICVLGGEDIQVGTSGARSHLVRLSVGLAFADLATIVPPGGSHGVPVRALTAWDHDANPSTREYLIVGGEFTRVNTTNVSNVARLEMVDVSGAIAVNDLRGGVSGQLQPRVLALTTWQFGSGPRSLVIGGTFATAGGLPIPGMALWNGSQYLAFGGQVPFPVALCAWDPDGALPGGERLVAATGTSVQYYDPSLVRFVEIGDNLSSIIGSVAALGVWDIVGTGAQPEFLFAGGFRSQFNPVAVDSVARINDTRSWLRCPQVAPTGPVHALAFADTDGPIQGIPNRLFVGGDFDQVASARANNVAQWNGVSWRNVGAGFNGRVRALLGLQQGFGPVTSTTLFAAGEFTLSGGTTVSRIARLQSDITGFDQWQPLGAGLNGAVHTMVVFDPDGPGPLPVQVIVGGEFTTAGGANANRVAAWTPSTSTWSALGTGMNGPVRALLAWDPDGSGSGLPRLIAGGSFSTASGFPIANLAQWDGVQWRAFEGGQPNGLVLSLGQRDRGGLRPRELVIGGTFTQIGTRSFSNLASWDGTRFDQFFYGVNGAVTCITSFEFDQTPSQNLQNEVVIGGGFTSSVNGNPTLPLNRLAFYNELNINANWRAFSDGATGGVPTAIVPMTPSPAGRPRLLIGGNFAARSDAAHLFVYTGTDPYILAQPSPTVSTACRGGDVSWTVSADGAALAYRWMRGNEPLFPGLTASGSVISGVDTPTLTIAGASPADAGSYRCDIANACRILSTRFVTLTIDLCGCPADFNLDDELNADDLSDFITCYFMQSSSPGFCPRADFNSDETVNADDLSDYITAYFAGCP